MAIVAGGPPAPVRAGVDWERVVSERGAHPRCGGVALGAVRRKSRRHVIGVGDARVITPVAGVTVRRRAGVPAPDMTIGAGRGRMRAGERKRRATMIEACRGPGGRAVTDLALLREAGSLVSGIPGVVVVGEMAGSTGRVQARVPPARVAIRASKLDVCARQRKLGVRVIECCPRPTGRAVTDGAILREPRGHVVGIRGSLEIGKVAGGAIPRRAGVPAVHVALGTRHGSVSPRQGESREGRVIECRPRPTGRVVADGAILREPPGHVVGIRGPLEIGKVAGGAIPRRAGEATVHVALGTRHGHVSPGQGESREGRVVELRSRPARRRMA